MARRLKANPCRQTLWARALRQTLIKQLGGKCVLCPESDPRKMEFDHKDGRDWVPNKLSYSARMKRYQREADAGKLRLLCQDCNLKAREKADSGAFVPTGSNVPRTTPILWTGRLVRTIGEPPQVGEAMIPPENRGPHGDGDGDPF